MDREFDIQSYMTGGVERIVSDALKATLKNPRESAYMLKFASASRKASKKRTAAQPRNTFSFNTFVIAMLVQSTFIAGHRLGMKDEKEIVDTNDPKVREETKKIFHELCFLNGINPENMAEIDSRSLFG